MAKQAKTITVEQIDSPHGARHDSEQTLIGLGLNKIGRARELPDTPLSARHDRARSQHLGAGRSKAS